MGCSGCWGGLCEFSAGSKDSRERDDFEKIVSFLGSVPLFRSQLPRSLLPKIAENLSWQAWKPGQKLIQQGDIGQAFFLIHSGEALVVSSSSASEAPSVRATLCPGDYFGGHTLLTERPNVATIVAKEGPAYLATLSMSRCAFEQLGLHHQLRFVKRPAFHIQGAEPAGWAPVATSSSSCWGSCWRALCPSREAESDAKCLGTQRTSEEELSFIRSAINANVNMRALMQASEDMLRNIAENAERREVIAGEVVTYCGEFAQEFFVVREGTFEVICEDAEGQQSAELAVARSTMADRLVRKHKFLKSLTRPESAKRPSTLGLEIRRECARRPSRLVKRRRTIESDGRPFETPEESARGPDQEENVYGMFHKEASGLSILSHASTVSCSSREELAHLDLAVQQEPTGGDADPLQNDELVGVFGPGESFGELSLLYNTKREATIKAREDGVLYVIGQRHITAHCSRMTQRFQEYCKLLDEVHALASLLGSERWELASSALGFVSFAAGERVMTQGKERQARLWYVVASGGAVLKLKRPGEDDEAVVGHLARGGQFGERTLLRNETASDISVDAGEDGMSCLTFDGKVVREILEKIFRTADDCLPSLEGDAAAWCDSWAEMNAKGWNSQIAPRRTCEIEFSKLEEICILGHGSFSTVVLVREQGSRKDRQYALKRMSKGVLQKHDMGVQVTWERDILMMVDSNFVVRLHRTYRDEYFLYFLLEACLGGNLLEVAKRQSQVFGDLRGSAMGFYAACIIGGLEHLHERRIAYRDLKPENVFLSNKGYGKLGDMGFARFVIGKTNTVVGTPEYMAPEMLSSPHSHTHCVDWWALGVVTFQVITGLMPFQCSDSDMADPRARMLAIKTAQERGKPKFPFGFPAAAQSFTEQLLEQLPQRLGCSSGAGELRQHHWFSALKFDFKALEKQTLKAPISLNRRPLLFGKERARPVSREAGAHPPFVDDGSGWDKEF